MKPMDCERIRREQIADEYRAGRLSADDADAYEQHYFSCESCFADLQLVDRVASQLQGDAGAEVFDAEIKAAQAEAEIRQAKEGRTAPARVTAPRHRTLRWWSWPLPLRPAWVVASVGVAALVIAGVFLQDRAEKRDAYGRLWSPSPYPYLAVEPRGSQGSVEFSRGMEMYQVGQYRDAITWLEQCIATGAVDPDVRFYLGVSLLLAGEPDRARSELLQAGQRTPSPAPYRWYLALAQLQCGRPGDARTLLEELAEEGGAFSADARDLLQRIARVQRR